MNQVFEFT